MNTYKIIGGVLLCLVGAGSGSRVSGSDDLDARGNQMSEQRAIESAISEFISAYNAGDLARVLAYYTEDLIKIRSGGPAETKPETAKRVAEVFAKFHSRVDVFNDEIRTSGDIAFTRGKFRVTLTPKAGGESQTIERRYLEIWRKENGRWLVARTMDNTD